MDNFAVSLQQCWLIYGERYTFIERIKWLATCLMILNVVVIAVSLTAANSPWTYTSFVVAHLLWVYAAWKTGERQIMVQSLAMIPLNMYGIYIR